MRQTVRRTRKQKEQTSTEAAAERTIEKHAMLILTARQTEAFANAIVNPPSPGRLLRQAARWYRARTAVQ